MRKPIVAGNWKMNKSVAEAIELAEGIMLDLAETVGVDVVLCPPFVSLKTVSDVVSGTHIKLGAQNMHYEGDGAYTGEVSAQMLRDVYCHYVIVGHSERRTYFGETDTVVNKKVKAALAATLRPIMCVGESLKQREAGETNEFVKSQVERGLAGITDGIENVIIAYEPIWAIGTGLTASPEQAQDVHAVIRGVVAAMFDDTIAKGMRIQYGGSMKPANAEELIGQPDIDGGLIGGAALDARSFVEIVRAASS